MNKKETEKQAGFAMLQGTKGRPLLAIVNSVARSGMSRRIELYTTDEKGNFDRIGYHVAHVIGWPYSVDKGGILVSGCGMDMVFHTVSTLNYAMCAMENADMSYAEQHEKFGRIYDTYWFNANHIQS
jgi:hypothetical protein